MAYQTREAVEDFIEALAAETAPNSVDPEYVAGALQMIYDSAEGKVRGALDFYPHIIGGLDNTIRFPVNANGIPQTNTGTMSITAMPDMGPYIAWARYECMKNPGSRLLIRGRIKTSWPFYSMPASGVIDGSGYYTSTVIFSGTAGQPFLCLGEVYVPELAMPIVPGSVSVAGGRTTFTIATTGFRERLAGGAPTAAWLDLPAGCDPWGQWLGEFSTFGLRDSGGMSSATTNYSRATMYAFGQDARTVTVEGTFAFTPTYICTPAMHATNGTYTALDSHPRHIAEVIRHISFMGRYNGRGYISHIRGIGGRPDPTMWVEHCSFARFYSFDLDFESDSHIKACNWGSPLDDGPTFAGVDSTFEDVQIAATQGVGVTLASDFGQCVLTGKWKLYYVSQDAATAAKARSIVVKTNGGALDFAGRLIVEDSAGPCFFFEHLVNNFHVHNFEANNAGAIGLGAPGSEGWKPWWPCDVVRISRNTSLEDISIKGIVRCAFGNREGQHVRSAVYIELANTTNWAQDGRPHLIRNMHIELDLVNGDYEAVPLNMYPDSRKSLWVSGASYTVGDLVQLVDTPQAIRYRASSTHSGRTTSPATDTSFWSYRGGGRNAWIAGFIIESFTGSFRPEFWNCEIIINGERDPSYHQRDLGNAGDYTVDPEHDVVNITRTADGESRYDVFRGREGKEQIWRANGASAARTVVLEPGFRGRGATPWQAGSIGTLSRPGSEMKTVHKGGRLHWVAHDQVETWAGSTLTLDISDFGKTILLTNSGAVTLTFPSASDLPSGWYVTLSIDHATGNIVSPSGVANPSAESGQYTEVMFKKRGTVIRQYGVV